MVALLISFSADSQKIDSIYINLYTDSLKKGTFNYINVDGLYSDGTWLPLDSSEIIFSSTHGVFYGNSLWLDTSVYKEPIKIKALLRKNKMTCKEVWMYVKQKEDPPLTQTNEEYLNELRSKKKKEKIRDKLNPEKVH
ncbi:MAG: hypothetical protein ABIP80_07470 [Ferruginibacter sp.]